MLATFERLTAAIAELTRLTDAKIQAVCARDPETLMRLLQVEIDAVRALDHFHDEVDSLDPAEKGILRQRLLHWQTRADHLQSLLQQNLGYIDFLRSLIEERPSPALDLNL